MKTPIITTSAFVYILVLLYYIQYSTQQQQYQTVNNNYEYKEYHDAWCYEFCDSAWSCSKTFQNDFIDTKLQLVYPYNNNSTVISQTFETQFLLDVAVSLDTSPCRLYLLEISHYSSSNNNNVPSPDDSDESSILAYEYNDKVEVLLRIYPADSMLIQNLTEQIQNEDSPFRNKGIVTRGVDSEYGLSVLKWDVSLKLFYEMSVITGGGYHHQEEATNDNYLNEGSKRWCENNNSNHISNVHTTPYCEFEWMFRQDLASALKIVGESQVQVLFIKPSGRGSVKVDFRFIPPDEQMNNDAGNSFIQKLVTDLVTQVQSYDSRLYLGNVTVRTDPTWGVSGFSPAKKKQSILHYSYMPTVTDLYERCKWTHRCMRAWNRFYVNTGEVEYTQQIFGGGEHYHIPLFANFEDWRLGTKGWRVGFKLNESLTDPVGAHWSPYNFTALGPVVPTFNTSTNSGLVLDNETFYGDILRQYEWIEELSYKIKWLNENLSNATMDAAKRSRADVRNKTMQTRNDYVSRREDELSKLVVLSDSQCRHVICELVFNTSSLELTGAINATGVVTQSKDSTEVAVWTFDSVRIGKEVNVTITGQRAMSLISRSSIYIDTSFVVLPGTLGGFPGGYSVGRSSDHRLVSVCDSLNDNRDEVEGFSCPGDILLSALQNGEAIASNNVNGPGSGSFRVYLKTLQVQSPLQKEVQIIETYADEGQTLGGYFKVHFGHFSTDTIPFDSTAGAFKRVIEEGLNAVDISLLRRVSRTNFTPGIGSVSVSRVSVGTSGGYRWTVTFNTALGDVPLLMVTSHLTGLGAKVTASTLQNGNSVGGFFQIHFLGNITRHLSHNITTADLENAIVEDIPDVVAAKCRRTLNFNDCIDGFCTEGPTQAGGHTWNLSILTSKGNISPTYPTSKEFDSEGFNEKMSVESFLTGCIDGVCPSIFTEDGHRSSSGKETAMNLKLQRPFSLAYGGVGGGYGGVGGKGFGYTLRGSSYGDTFISNLYGGSGGGIGYVDPFEVNMFGTPSARGGSGGGALSLTAIGDITIGSNCVLAANGQNGFQGYMTGGGGGSGGSIHLSAGGVINFKGKAYARGGDGGNATDPLGRKDIIDGYGGGGGGGRIALFGQSISNKQDNIDVSGGVCLSSIRDCNGQKGTIFQYSLSKTSYFIDRKGAMGTFNSLFIKGERQPKEICVIQAQDGPLYHLKGLPKPTRISFHLMLEGLYLNGETEKGVYLELLDRKWADEVLERPDDGTTMIGIFVGQVMKYGSNYNGLQACSSLLNQLTGFHSPVLDNHWYHIDIRISWEKKTYDVFIDDLKVVNDAEFEGEEVRYFSVRNSYSTLSAWIDEIVVGHDYTMGFLCPIVSSKGIEMVLPSQRRWKDSDVGPKSSLFDMVRHESHLSRRSLYKSFDNGGLVPFDGEGHQRYTSDIKFREATGYAEGSNFTLGALLSSPIVNVFGERTYYWYGQHKSKKSNVDLASGVGVCSTKNFIDWENKGVVLNNINITDMVTALNGPFTIQRPRVIYNDYIEKYIMWMTIDNIETSYGAAGIAVSDYADGPFEFVRSFYPDGNETRDQTVFVDEKMASKPAYLVRTYYAEVEFELPAAVMQPLWESVKNVDGSTNYALSYHRALYEPGYDDYHDIYIQRWRMEHQPWKIICVNRITGEEREVPYGEEYQTKEGMYCIDPIEEKKILGLGDPSTGPVRSRFLDPLHPANNAWKPDSVPGVKAQPWSANYKDGSCGKRKLDDDIQELDADLPHLLEEVLGEKDCDDGDEKSNKVDNPIHSTPSDKLIGNQRIVETRRAKYIAISKLTKDYLDITGDWGNQMKFAYCLPQSKFFGVQYLELGYLSN